MTEPLPERYESLGRAEKLDLLWSRVTADPYPLDALPLKVPSALDRLRLLSVGHNRLSFEHGSDELPEGRNKLVHRFGTVARVRWEVTSPTRFTGVMASGGDGLLRLSDAEGGARFRPSVALKIPVDGRASLNLFGLPAATRDETDRNFLSGAFANSTPHVNRLDAKLVARAFQKTARALEASRVYPVYLPLHELAELELDGSPVSEPVVADRLELHPTEAARAAFDPALDWRLALAELPAGLALFDVRVSGAIDEPAAPLGSVVLEKSFIASRYGDDRLFFQHHTGPRGPAARS